jgi:hypothetical protein
MLDVCLALANLTHVHLLPAGCTSRLPESLDPSWSLHAVHGAGRRLLHVLDEHPSLPFPHSGREKSCGWSPSGTSWGINHCSPSCGRLPDSFTRCIAAICHVGNPLRQNLHGTLKYSVFGLKMQQLEDRRMSWRRCIRTASRNPDAVTTGRRATYSISSSPYRA